MPLPYLAAPLLDQRRISEVSPRRVRCLFLGHTVFDQLVDLLLTVLLNLLREITVKTATREQLLDPVHDSPSPEVSLFVAQCHHWIDPSSPACRDVAGKRS